MTNDADLLLAQAREIYQSSRDGQSAVEAWARRPEIEPYVTWTRCEPCEETTPSIDGICAVCETPNLDRKG